MKLSVVFDFDGVISENRNGWEGVSVINERPVEGIKEAIDEIREHYKVIILSQRCSTVNGLNVLKDWLDGYDIRYDDLTDVKPQAVAYIDDKAICFNGNSKNLLKEIQNFQPWNVEKEEFIEYKPQPGDKVEFEIFKGSGTKYEGEVRYEFKMTNHFNPSYNNSLYYRVRSNFESYDVPLNNIIRKVGN